MLGNTDCCALEMLYRKFHDYGNFLFLILSGTLLKVIIVAGEKNMEKGSNTDGLEAPAPQEAKLHFLLGIFSRSVSWRETVGDLAELQKGFRIALVVQRSMQARTAVRERKCN